MLSLSLLRHGLRLRDWKQSWSGGNGVNLHAYSRTTFDVDLLVGEADAEGWLSFFKQRIPLISQAKQ